MVQFYLSAYWKIREITQNVRVRRRASNIGAVTSDHPRIIDHEDILGVALITAVLVRRSTTTYIVEAAGVIVWHEDIFNRVKTSNRPEAGAKLDSLRYTASAEHIYLMH